MSEPRDITTPDAAEASVASGPEAPPEPSEGSPAEPAEPGHAETTFEDADAPPAGGPDAEPAPEPEAPADGASDAPAVAAGDDATRYLELARRTQADFENYRKRMARENAQAAGRGAARLAKELLPALDHLELALQAGGEADAEVVRGFAMVRDELLSALERSGIQAFSPEGQPFDPSEHEAMAQQPAEGAAPGTVVQVYQRGYRMDGGVLRPARVVVAP